MLLMTRTELRMRHIKLIGIAGVMAVLLLAGCASAPERVLSRKAPAYAMLPNGHDPLNPDQISPLFAAASMSRGPCFAVTIPGLR